MQAIAPDIAEAYATYDRRIGVSRIRVGVILAMVLLPLGAVADYFVYHPRLWDFFKIRLLVSALMAPFLLLIRTQAGQRYYRALGVLLAMCPAVCMMILINEAGGAKSAYYAGLNLVLLTIGLVLRWTLVESLISFALVMVMYLAVCWTPYGTPDFGVFFNNVYFLLLTGLIVMTGNHLQSRLRIREFTSNQQLEASRKELEHTNQRLMELDELKGRFFANISHELRTPLTLLIAPLESFRHRYAASLDGQAREWLDTMQGSGLRLLKLINDLLDLVRLDTNRLKLEMRPVVLHDFLNGLLNSAKGVAYEKRLKLSCDIEPGLTSIRADPDKLEKVFLNLLFNSVKFTPAAGSISIRAWRDGDYAKIAVTDTGMGIAPENVPHIFDRFWQADSSSNRKFQGAGIGLALVKELVGAHQGTVEVQSEPGKGTTMLLRLPIGAPAETELREAAPAPPVTEPAVASPPGEGSGDRPPAPSAPENAWLVDLYRRAEMFSGIPNVRETRRPALPHGARKRPQLLIVDDEPDMLRFLKSQLSEAYEIIEAVDGAQAVTLATQYLPELILCDMMLPEKDGMQVCRELRARTSTKSLPFLMLTARADDETKLQALEAGANDFLTKPFSFTELRVRLSNLAEAHHLQKELEWQNQKLERANEELKEALEQLKETEIQLVQSEKMASLGRMSAGIIHEINNPLNFARTGLHVLSRQSRLIPEGERADYEEILRDIQDGITRVAAIVSDLRSFTHPHAGISDDVNIRECVDAALRFLAAEWKSKVDVRNEVSPDTLIRANRNMLLHVCTNLLQNSLDAVRIKQFSPGEEPATIRIHADRREGDGALLLHIWDNGVGIAESHLAKIFDPFYTTKEIGEGTGLGLSICYRIMRGFGGRIDVDTEPGKYCEFTLEFPTQIPDHAITETA